MKATIVGEYLAEPEGVTAVLLLGHVPVPYSGDFAPDGHSAHKGAWPADAYYGDMNRAWSDEIANDSAAADSRNWNTPHDGKFDQTTLPSLVELQVGRVDMANMLSLAETETELLRQYLNKNHRFRHALIATQMRALIDDQLSNSVEAFAANGWRSFSSLFRSSNVSTGSWFSELSQQSELWAYGCGPGTYTSAGTIDLRQFSGAKSDAVFTALFGSYFGDWDATDSLLRAPLANAGSGLTCAWAGRPFWHFHQIGHGHTIGCCTRVAQNNSGRYPANANPRGVHIALMGDPTLRLHPVARPCNLTATRAGQLGARLSWSASPAAVASYHTYRAAGPDGAFARLNSFLVTATTFEDRSPLRDGVYMIRAVKLQETSGGTYWNASQGIFADLDLPGVTVTSSVPETSSLGSHAAEFTFIRSGSLVSPLSVHYLLRGDAINAIDYEALSGELNIAPGRSAEVLQIVPKANGDIARRRWVRVFLNGRDTYVRKAPASAIAVITDDRHALSPYRGDYWGVFADSASSGPTGGFIRISVNQAGRFSAVLQFSGQRVHFVGTLDGMGTFSTPIPGIPGHTIELNFHLERGSDSIAGRLAIPRADTARFIARRVFAGPGNSMAAGRYTVALMPNAPPSDPLAPQGPGWGMLRIGSNGRGRFAGVLGDAIPFSCGVLSSRDGRWPLLARPYHFKGWIGGEVTFSDAPGVSDASGKLHWERSQFRTAALFPQRFAADVTIIATRFFPIAC